MRIGQGETELGFVVQVPTRALGSGMCTCPAATRVASAGHGATARDAYGHEP